MWKTVQIVSIGLLILVGLAGLRMSEGMIGVAVGVLLGVLASVPVAILVLARSSRVDIDRARFEGERAALAKLEAREPPARQTSPSVIIIHSPSPRSPEDTGDYVDGETLAPVSRRRLGSNKWQDEEYPTE